MITETHPTTKAAVAKALAELGVELSASRVKKTPPNSSPPSPPWTESSIKSALYWDVTTVKGCGVRTETADDGTQRYHLLWRAASCRPFLFCSQETRRRCADQMAASQLQSLSERETMRTTLTLEMRHGLLHSSFRVRCCAAGLCLHRQPTGRYL
jgi:hypothetical protein